MSEPRGVCGFTASDLRPSNRDIESGGRAQLVKHRNDHQEVIGSNPTALVRLLAVSLARGLRGIWLSWLPACAPLNKNIKSLADGPKPRAESLSPYTVSCTAFRKS